MDSSASTQLRPTPQQRWQQFRDNHLPTLTSRQKWLALGVSVLVVILFVVLVLPFLLPFAGPKPADTRSLADPEGAFTTIEGTEIYYTHYPNPGQTVLLLHGQGGSTLSWQHTFPALQEAGYNIYVLDLPGAGLSEKGLDLDYSHPHAARIILDFLRGQGVEQAHIVAHAFSANIAVMAAQQQPDRIGKLALVAPTLITASPPEVPRALIDIPFLKRWARVAMHLVIPVAVEEQLLSATKHDDVVTEELVADYSRVLHTEGWDLAAIGMVRDSHRNALPDPLETLRLPVLLMWGSGDGWAPPEAAQDLLEALPSARLVEFEGVGHLPMHETPADFNAALILFLDN
ncbi:MAG: alpha/beta hydrolase [Chloroflexi bacterium]|nr:alpha/beta hydrolase [Chloroflexota bacterium]